MKKLKDFKTHHQALFAVLIGVGVVSFWRGVWGLMDLYVLPSNDALSFLTSIVIGLLILGGTHYLVKELM